MHKDTWYQRVTVELTSDLRTSSGTFLEELHSLKAEEWENMTGALLASRASFMVWTDACDKSTIMPSRFISRTTAWKRKCGTKA